MPDPKKYKNKDQWMRDCLHQTVHVEKKDQDQGIAQCLNMWKKRARHIVHKFINADYPDNPDEVVINSRENIEGLKEIREIDVYNYYSGIKNELIKELKGYNLFVVVKPKGELKKDEKGIYIRHPYDKKTEYIRINNDKEFEAYHSGRTVEYHLTTPQLTPWYIIDIDPGTGTFTQLKKVVANVANQMNELPEIKNVEIRYTGKRGFHIIGWLKQKKDIDQSRKYLSKWLKGSFIGDDVVIGESPQGKKIALGLSPMKLNGGHVAKYSLRISGLCCIEIPRNKLLSFEKKGASISMTYKKVTGTVFQLRESARRVISSFLKQSIIWVDPIIYEKTPRLKRQYEVLKDISKSEIKEFAKPGEMVQVLEGNKFVEKPYKPNLIPIEKK